MHYAALANDPTLYQLLAAKEGDETVPDAVSPYSSDFSNTDITFRFFRLVTLRYSTRNIHVNCPKSS